MLTLPKAFAILLTTFAPLFTRRVWHHVQVLMVGAMLAPGKRTVTAALRGLGLAHARCFQPYHRVLNRAIWASLDGARLLLLLDRKSTRLNSSHANISYAVFCLKNTKTASDTGE